MWHIVFVFTMMTEGGMAVIPVERPEDFATHDLCEARRAELHLPVMQATAAGQEEHGFILMGVASSCVDRGLPA